MAANFLQRLLINFNDSCLIEKWCVWCVDGYMWPFSRGAINHSVNSADM